MFDVFTYTVELNAIEERGHTKQFKKPSIMLRK